MPDILIMLDNICIEPSLTQRYYLFLVDYDTTYLSTIINQTLQKITYKVSY